LDIWGGSDQGSTSKGTGFRLKGTGFSPYVNPAR
jgi:hypothetical protein